jgi:hypothetical protein
VDLRPPLHLSDRIRAVLSDHAIVVHQRARLLDSEVADIRLNGLRAASTSLLSDKVEAARGEGLLTEDQAERLLTTGVFTAHQQREARIEITYFWQAHTYPDLAEVLKQIGNPVLIEFQHRPSPSDLCSPELANIVIGRYRNLDDCAGEVHIRVQRGERIPRPRCLATRRRPMATQPPDRRGMVSFGQ